MYFPLFIELKGKPCLVIGGGRVAHRKVQTLTEYGARVTVVAKELRMEFDFPDVVLVKRAFSFLDLQGQELVFVTTQDETLNREIAALCRRQQIPVNVADIPEQCDFYFPALVRRGETVIGISTGGNSPALAGALRRELDQVLPKNLAELTEQIGALRREILKRGEHPAENEEYNRLLDQFYLDVAGEGNRQ